MGGVALWLFIGVCVSVCHMWLLRLALARAGTCDPAGARKQILRGYPFRLLLYVPVLLMAARSGTWACAALVAGSWAVRWAACGFVGRQRTCVEC